MEEVARADGPDLPVAEEARDRERAEAVLHEAEVVVGRWRDGRLGTVRGTRRGSYAMGFVCFCEKGVAPAQVVIGRLYRDLLVEVVAMFRSGRSPLSAEELLEPIAFQEAALRSKEGGGEEVAGYLAFQAKAGDLIEQHLRGGIAETDLLDRLQTLFETSPR